MVKSTTEWLAWAQVPHLQRAAGGGELQLGLRLVEEARVETALAPFLARLLPEVASEFTAYWAAVVASSPRGLTKIGEFGRAAAELNAIPHLDEVLDRDQGLYCLDAADSGWGFVAVPLGAHDGFAPLLVLGGKGITGKSLPAAMLAGRLLGMAVRDLREQERETIRTHRLRETLRIASELSLAKETESLLSQIAVAAARLLEADRSSIFIWDKEHKELVGCPALGVEGNRLRIRDDAGIVGECLHAGQPILVDDAYADPRFNRKIDQASGYKTRNLLCVPLLDAAGDRIGVFEAINKLQGVFTPDDSIALADLGVQAATALANTREREQLARRQEHLTEQVSRGVELVGDSPAIAALRDTITRLSSNDLPVLVLGESGTGKEVVAQLLHFGGPHRNNPFVAVNCAALPETLLESELFGHEKGAFTDAREARAGKFEMAEGGTLFLDEIGDMSLGGQAKLLRVLEQKVITRVGGSQPIRVNVRVLAATNAKLAQKVREKKFRDDLYYRLSVVTIELPPLRERPDDIVPLAEFFLKKFAVQAGRRSLQFAADAKKRLQAHAWPGNVRELRNLVERVAYLCPQEQIHAQDLAFVLNPEPVGDLDGASDMGLTEATSKFQEEYIRKMIRRVRGNMTDASKLLGLHRSNLYRKMRQLGMNEELRDVTDG